MLILDFSKAFDTVPHKRLLKKLESYGINGNILSWLEAWLTQREQQVTIEGDKSSTAKVTSGVPQGTVQSPLMFLLYS
jgi:retron-type reverse transcriptase